MHNISQDNLMTMYRAMLRIRLFEERALYESSQGRVHGALHLYVGQEAVGVGVCANLHPQDYVTSTHRGHGHAIAKGAEFDRMMAELFGRVDGYCHGKGGSMHIADVSVGMLGANGVVGGGIAMAVGAAFAAQLKGTDNIAVCFFGEGASNRGTFHEGVNLGAVWNTPVLFVCENNLYGQYTHQSKTMRLSNVADRASAYGIAGRIVDGNDVLAVYQEAREAIEEIRAGNGPILLEAKTYRLTGHALGDPGYYRTEEEIEEWRKQDPIPRFRQHLFDHGVMSPAEDEELHAKIEAELEDAVEFALASPYPEPEELWTHIFADTGDTSR